MHAYDLYLLLCIKCTFKKLAIDSEHLLSNSCLNASYWIFVGGAAGDECGIGVGADGCVGHTEIADDCVGSVSDNCVSLDNCGVGVG